MKLASVLEAISRVNDFASWDRLLRFPSRCFRSPTRSGVRRSLAAAINRQLFEEIDSSTTYTSSHSKRTHRPPPDPIKSLSTRLSLKLEEVDFRGAVNLVCSEDTIADMSEATLLALKQKHPPPHPHSRIPQFPKDSVVLSSFVSVEEVIKKAIKSFPNGSAGGPDGLRPQHLKDMVGQTGGSHDLLTALANFLTLVLSGRTPHPFALIFLVLT